MQARMAARGIRDFNGRPLFTCLGLKDVAWLRQEEDSGGC